MLFHFTRSVNLLQIISDNQLLPGFNGTISFTRNPNHFYIQKFFGFNACLILDRDKLNNNYRIDLDYGWIAEYNRSSQKQAIGSKLYEHYRSWHKILASKEFLFSVAKKHGRESEEIIRKPITNLNRYILEIVVDNKPLENLFLRYGQENNITVSSAKFNYDKCWFHKRIKL